MKSKIAHWFWCGVFGELYGGAIESRFAKDVTEVVRWIRKGGTEASTITDAAFATSRLLTLRTRNSAAYKGIYALLMLDGGLDFRTGDSINVQTYFDEKIDIHHIFPKKWCEDTGVHRRQYDSIINKTAISARTNPSYSAAAVLSAAITLSANTPRAKAARLGCRRQRRAWPRQDRPR